MRKLLLLACAASLTGCILFDPDARVRPFCQLVADECDGNQDDVDECEEDARARRQDARQEGSDCAEVLEAEDAFHICVLQEDDVDCNLFQTFPGCEDEFEEFIREAFEAGNQCN